MPETRGGCLGKEKQRKKGRERRGGSKKVRKMEVEILLLSLHIR